MKRMAPDQRRESIVAAALDVACTGVTHDSRRVVPGSMFVALRGMTADGLSFVPQAVAAGAAVIVSEHPASAVGRVPWVVVRNARRALALLAAEFYGHPSRQMQVVGITGTNGKTTVTRMISHILSETGQTVGTVVIINGHAQIDGTVTNALIIFDGIATWSEFILAQIFLRQNSNRTLPLGLLYFTSPFGSPMML